MTIRIGELATLDRVISIGQSAGFARTIPRLPCSLSGRIRIGFKRCYSRLFAILAAQGQRKEPYLIERIDDADGNIIYQAHPGHKQAISPAIAWMIAQTARGVIERGTAASAKSLGLTRYAAGKTGTTDDYKDAWFVGFTNSLTCGVWVGFDQPRTNPGTWLRCNVGPSDLGQGDGESLPAEISGWTVSRAGTIGARPTLLSIKSSRHGRLRRGGGFL